MVSRISVMVIPILIANAGPSRAQSSRPYLHAPAVNRYAEHNPSGTTVLPTGRFLTPCGKHLPVAKWPHALVLSPDEETAFVVSEDVGQLITGWDSASPKIGTVTPKARNRAKESRTSSGGAAFSLDGSTLYWSSGDRGGVYVVNAMTGEITREISLNVAVAGKEYAESFAMDIAIDPTGTLLYCADVANFRVVVVDLRKGAVVGSVAAGRYPYALAVSGKRVYVANIGLFAYSAIPAPTDGHDPRGLTRPAFGFPSKEARDGVDFEGRRVPGLGDPNVPESFSVWGIDASDPAAPKVVAKIKTGLLLGAPSDVGKTVGGSAPNFLVARGDNLWVSNGNNDRIERIDLRTHKVVVAARITPSPLTKKLRGVAPAGMALSADGSKLLVAEMGINAIGVFDAKTLQALGHIPTAWYPYRVAVAPRHGKVLTIAFRGFGNGPRLLKPQSGPYLGMKGVLSSFSLPSAGEMSLHTQTVLRNNGLQDRRATRSAMTSSVVPTTPGVPSREIKHVVFITKENHTYDAVFDRIPGARHDPSLLRWGLDQRIAQEGQPTLDHVGVMVNHNALAREFSVSDNFYMEPEASGVGHRWLVGVQPNNLMQMTYTLGWKYNQKSAAPGRLYPMESNGSILPDEYPEAGSMWEHLWRNGKSFRNYGEGFELPGVDEGEGLEPTGAREVGNYPMPKPLFDNTCFDFPIFNMNIPDQYRVDAFVKDFNKLNGPGKKPMPAFINIAICNDHGAAPKPAKGYPYNASWMADNDLALGRLVEFLSHTPYWKNMAIFVTQDDSGGEPDHVDAQRSIMMVISPWAKRGYVSHRLTTIVSMHRTLYQILGLPPLNMFDALASDLSDCFTTKPDYRPYKTLPVDKRLFDAKLAYDPKDPEFRAARRSATIRMDDPEEVERLERASRPAGQR